MKTFDPPLKVGDRVRIRLPHPETLIVVQAGQTLSWAKAGLRADDIALEPEEEGLTWRRIKPLAVGDEVIIIERRSGIVASVSDETALVETSWVEINPLRTERVPIELAAEGQDWERAKE